MKRETRNLQHEKGGRIREVNYLPIKSDGQDGDARMFDEDLFIKTKGSWVKIMSGDKIINQEITRNINNIVSEGVLQHTSLTGVTANQHHNQVHSIDGSDHTGTLSVAKGGTGVGLSTGTVKVVLSNSPILVTPALGTPASGVLTNCTGYTGDSSLVTSGALNSGSITSGFGNIDNGSSSIACGSLDLSDGNITNVGNIALDTISSDASTSIGVTLGTDAGDDFNVGSGKLVVEGDTGNVGIGTTGPAYLLEVKADASATWLSRLYNEGTTATDNGLLIRTGSDAATTSTFATYAGSGYTMVVKGDGKVGIGVTDPDTALEVLAGTTNQLKLSFDGTDNCTFGVDTNGYITITPSGSKILIADNDSIGSSSYASGFFGNGWIVDDGTTADATFDNLTVRSTMSIYELLIQQIRCTNGSLMISSVAKVESSSGLSASDDSGTITFESTTDGPSTCPFLQHDIIMCQQINPGAFVDGDVAGDGTNVIKKMVYRVLSVSANVCTVAFILYDNLETNGPVAGDDFVRIGNASVASRQSVMYLTSDDTNAPFIDMKADIDTYAAWHAEDSVKLRLGRLDGLTAGGTNEYGLWAGPSTTNYIKAGSGGLVLKGSEATYLSASANTLEFYDTNKKMEVTGGNITMYADNGSTVISQWDNTSLTLGGAIAATDDCIAMSATGGVKVYDNSTDFVHVSSTGVAVHTGDASNASAVFGATTYIGLQASEHIKLTGSSFEMKDGSVVMMSLADGDIGMKGKINITSVATNNVCMGSWSSGDPDVGEGNIVIGVDAGNALDANTDNVVLIGKDAGKIITGSTGSDAVAVGHGAMAAIVAPEDSTAVGYQAHYRGATSKFNVAIGHKALYGKDTALWARYNVAVGTGSMENADGDTDDAGGAVNNTAVGHQSMMNLDGGANNVGIGHSALKAIEGTYNIGIGVEAGATITSGSGNVVIGKAVVPSLTGDDQLSISSGEGDVVWIAGDSSGHVDLKVKSKGVAAGCKIKIFEGTTAAVSNTTEITHGITNGKKRICMINTMVANDADPSGTAPAGAFLAPGGIYQDEGDEDFEYTTYYDDTKIYIYIETSASDVASNQYVCSIWYTDADMY